MQFPGNYHRNGLRGKQKGIKQILVERGLWEVEYRIECPKSKGRLGWLPGRNCQQGQWQVELEARGQRVIFSPKFHCEMNPIDQYWGRDKWYTREFCECTLDGLRTTEPLALEYVPLQWIWPFLRPQEDHRCIHSHVLVRV